MAYNDDAVLAKLSAVNESHDSISSSAQWILFHRRHATRTVELWFNRLKSSSSTKRLSLVYLANELAQQSKIRNKMDFIEAFSPVMPEAIATAYKGAPSEVQGKIKRVIDVWRDRRVFEDAIQEAIDARLADLDKLKGANAFGGPSPFSSATATASAIPSELSNLVTHHQSIAKCQLPAKTAVVTADQDHTKLFDPSAPPPPAPVYAARLNGLLRVLASAEGAVAESVKARKSLIAELERLLNTNRATLVSDEKQLKDLEDRKGEIEQKKHEVETSIMRGLSTTSDSQASPTGDGPSSHTPPEPDRPEVEALTPPSVSEEPELPEDASTFAAPSAQQGPGFQHAPAPGIEMLSHLASQYQSLPLAANGSNKRRRLDGEDEFPDLGGDEGIDADVAEMLRKDSAIQ